MMDLFGLLPPHNPSIYMRCGLGLPIARRTVDELIEFIGSGSSHVVTRHAIDEIAKFSGETETPKYMKVNAMIVKMEAMNDPDEYFDSLMCLRDSKRMGNDQLLLLNGSIAGFKEEISTLEAHLEIIYTAINSE
ncbi:hypothetical protein Tco_0104105 [Tanacetum coccineum]